jgi:hypothetical protein
MPILLAEQRDALGLGRPGAQRTHAGDAVRRSTNE